MVIVIGENPHNYFASLVKAAEGVEILEAPTLGWYLRFSTLQ
jgi:hypothetical protein